MTVRGYPAALIVQHLYHNKYLTTINFIEEVLPFTDVIPTATIGKYPLNPITTAPAPSSFAVVTCWHGEGTLLFGVDPLCLCLSDFRVVHGVHKRR